MKSNRALLLPLAAILIACGGGADPDAYQAATELANAKEAEARALAVTTPCAQVSECAYLTFMSPTGGCSGWYYTPYLLVSSSAAAASAAATEQNALARKAIVLAPPTGIFCPAFVAPPPVLACTASTCVAVR